MKTLTLLRHAKSSWNHPGLADFDRPLNERGLRNAPAMGRFYRESILSLVEPPALLLSSPSQRTRQTMDLFLPAAGLAISQVDFQDRLYLASASKLKRIVQDTDDSVSHVLITGHNPGLEDLAAELSPGSGRVDRMPTCVLVVLKFDVDFWALAETAVSSQCMAPRLLPEAG